AGEVLEHLLIFLLLGASDRHHVGHPQAVGIKRRERMIEEHSLMKIGVERVGAKREQPPSELQHVINAARLARSTVDAAAQLVRESEVLVESLAASRVAVVL